MPSRETAGAVYAAAENAWHAYNELGAALAALERADEGHPLIREYRGLQGQLGGLADRSERIADTIMEHAHERA